MPELPSGTVTFLFTGIEGSTRLLQQLRGHHPELLEAHHRLLRAVSHARRRLDGFSGPTSGRLDRRPDGL